MSHDDTSRDITDLEKDTTMSTPHDSGMDDILGPYDEPIVGPLDAPDRPSAWHPVNITQLVMGIAFAGLVVIWALDQAGVVGGDDYRWLLPIPWLAAGAAGLAATVLPSRRQAAGSANHLSPSSSVPR